jgi:hypothetical protein
VTVAIGSFLADVVGRRAMLRKSSGSQSYAVASVTIHMSFLSLHPFNRV